MYIIPLMRICVNALNNKCEKKTILFCIVGCRVGGLRFPFDDNSLGWINRSLILECNSLCINSLLRINCSLRSPLYWGCNSLCTNSLLRINYSLRSPLYWGCNSLCSNSPNNNQKTSRKSGGSSFISLQQQMVIMLLGVSV